MRVRRAEAADRGLLLAWRNDPRVYRWFFTDRPVGEDEHAAWIERMLADPRSILLIGLAPDPVGAVRFDLSEDGRTAEVNIHVAGERQGMGLGPRLLAEAERWLVSSTAVRSLVARVRGGNRASQRMFEQGGFAERERTYEKSLVGEREGRAERGPEGRK